MVETAPAGARGARLPSHMRRPHDQGHQVQKTNEDLAARLGSHLELTKPLDDLALKLAPLPVSDDVSRMQPPYFHEFTCTHVLGFYWVSPQSAEAAARMLEAAAGDESVTESDFPVIEPRDKYRLDTTPYELPKKVVFLPADNIFTAAVDFPALFKLMWEDESVMIKLHPLTSDPLKRHLGRAFGYHRLIEPNESGNAALEAAETVYITQATEMGLYAILAGKEVVDLTNFLFRPRCAYMPIYRLLLDRPVEDAKATLLRVIASPLSGIMRPEDPDVEARMTAYFAAAMAVRAGLRPLVQEFTADRWGTASQSMTQPQKVAAKPAEAPKPAAPAAEAAPAS